MRLDIGARSAAALTDDPSPSIRVIPRDHPLAKADHQDLTDLPPVASWIQDGFHTFLKPYLRRHFHALAVDRSCRTHLDLAAELPVVVYGNHPSWWDPVVAHFLNRTLLAPRQFYAPIDADALEQYAVFKKLGFFGVKSDSSRGAGAFLKQSTAILRSDAAALWITPEGRFTDARDHSVELMPGLAHLSQKMTDGYMMPFALEYPFWEERLPNCLARFGQPIRIAHHTDLDKAGWNVLLNQRLRQTQRELADLVVSRDSKPFENLLSGQVGAGGVYDMMRRMKSLMSGKSFKQGHGEQFN